MQPFELVLIFQVLVDLRILPYVLSKQGLNDVMGSFKIDATTFAVAALYHSGSDTFILHRNAFRQLHFKSKVVSWV